MNEKIQTLLEQIHELENELRDALQEHEDRARYHIQGKRIEFEKTVRETHQKLKKGLICWCRESQPLNILSAPFIYGMIIPLMIYDLSLTIYQHICFRLYRVPRVNRSDYIIIDRHHLAYLNTIEKINCAYCGYGNGLIAYAREITARTEQYWCPIKHAHKVLDTHTRYPYFLSYGDPADLQKKIDKYREQLRNEK